MTIRNVDNQVTIDHVRSLIADAASNSRTHVSDLVRLRGERMFVIGYLQALLTEGIISQEMCNKLIAELEAALKDALKAKPATGKKVVRKLKS
ncbi:hypothetical protein [Pseudomonas syringae pv. coryli]|uniref:hypothetical protein n=1 Tax=Pseudomonas syringae pv. coryli TaxID=317659 RepID=UPI003D292A0C